MVSYDCRGERRLPPPDQDVEPAFSDGAEVAPLMTLGAPLWSQSAARANSGTQSYFGNGAPLSTCSALTM